MITQTTFYIARHGQAEFNLKGIIGGTLEPNLLTVKGEDQAKLLAEKYQNIKFDKIYSSDLVRAKKTAEIIASAKNLPVQINELLRERNWGTLQGKTFTDAQSEYAKAFEEERMVEGEKALDFRYIEDMESLRSAVLRFDKFIKNTVKTELGKTLLIVSHFDIMIGYLVFLKYGIYQDLMNATFDHTGYYTLIYNGNKISVGTVIGLQK